MIKLRLLIALLICTVNVQSLAAISMTSPAFQNEGLIPKKYSCYGANISPPLSWKDAPIGTKSFVLTIDDIDSKKGPMNHWVLYNIPSEIDHLDEATPLPTNAAAANNSWGKAEYTGPCPASGLHRYVFTLYAVDALLDFTSDVSKKNIMEEIKYLIIGKTELKGQYKHP